MEFATFSTLEKVGCLGSSWGHLGAILGPSWGHLGAILRQDGFRQEVSEFLSPIWGPFWGPKLAFLGLFLGPVFGPNFEHFLDNFWGHFGDHFGTRSAQEGAKMGPRGPPRASKTQNPAFAKTLKNHMFFQVFGVQRPPKKGSRGPGRLPRGTERARRPEKKNIQKST